ncbi:MAG TPA: hypothetical protein VMT00_09185 [Thermoanaerobaculia bacterium]|nr:hypothetical protein [Thermoanaerobaculia bacterium]
MSKQINVNPDHYKTAGRERPGDGIVQKYRKEEVRTAHSKTRNFIPGAAPVGASNRKEKRESGK